MKRRGQLMEPPLASRHASFKFTQSEQAKRDFLKRLGSDLQNETGNYRQTYSHSKQTTKPIDKTSAEDFYSTMEVRSWGSGSSGQLGLGDDRHCSTPSLMLALYHITTDLSQIQLHCGDLLTAAINELGHVYVWGRLPLDTCQIIRVPERVTGLENVCVRQLSCGSGHMALVSDKGALYTWGRGESGRLGHGEEHNVYVPRRVHLLTPIRQVACGEEHTLLLDDKGSLYSFGSGRAGQLGLGTYSSSYEPALIPPIPGTSFAQIACGMNHCGALTDTGLLYTWGWGEQGRLGHGNEDTQPSLKCVDALRHLTLTKISCGGAHSLALASCKKVFSWGWGAFGQLGHGNSHDYHTPKAIKTLDQVHLIACGYGHSAAITESGALYLWGFGEEGQLGTGDEFNHDTPQLVWRGAGESSKALHVDPPRVLQISLGKAHSMAVGLLSMQQERRRQLNPENIRMAATTLQCFVRSAVARINLAKLRKAQAQRHQKQLEEKAALIKMREAEAQKEQARLDAEKQLRAQQAIAQAQHERALQKLRHESALIVQAASRRYLARKQRYECMEEQKQLAEARRQQEQEHRLQVLEDMVAEETPELVNSVVDEYLTELLEEVYEHEDARAEEEWRLAEEEKLARDRRVQELERQMDEAKKKAMLQEQARLERELRRQEALAKADAEHRAKRDREIAEAKAKLKARKELALQPPPPSVSKPTKLQTRRRKLKEKQKQRVADELNASREERERLRAMANDQKRRLDEQQKEKEVLNAKIESERRQRMFRKSLKESPTIRPNAAFQVRSNYIAETTPAYRVIAGEVKPHYVLDPFAIPNEQPTRTDEGGRTTSKHRIFRELQRSSTNGVLQRHSKSSEGRRGQSSNQIETTTTPRAMNEVLTH